MEEKNKEIMITKFQRGNKSSSPKLKSTEEKRLKLLHRPLAILKILVIHFPPKAPQEAREAPCSTQQNSECYQQSTSK
jgi:hypothetical protein